MGIYCRRAVIYCPKGPRGRLFTVTPKALWLSDKEAARRGAERPEGPLQRGPFGHILRPEGAQSGPSCYAGRAFRQRCLSDSSVARRGKSNICPQGPLRPFGYILSPYDSEGQRCGPSALWSRGSALSCPKGARRGPEGTKGGQLKAGPLWAPLQRGPGGSQYITAKRPEGAQSGPKGRFQLPSGPKGGGQLIAKPMVAPLEVTKKLRSQRTLRAIYCAHNCPPEGAKGS